MNTDGRRETTTAAYLPSVLTGCGRWPPTTRSPPGWTSTAAASSSECADAPQCDEARIVQVLDRHCVAYVLVGGLGALLHGASRPTLDFDLCAAWDLDNLGRLVDALRELGAELRVRPGVQPPTVDAHLLHDRCRDDVADNRRRHLRAGRDPVQPPGRPEPVR